MRWYDSCVWCSLGGVWEDMPEAVMFELRVEGWERISETQENNRSPERKNCMCGILWLKEQGKNKVWKGGLCGWSLEREGNGDARSARRRGCGQATWDLLSQCKD